MINFHRSAFHIRSVAVVGMVGLAAMGTAVAHASPPAPFAPAAESAIISVDPAAGCPVSGDLGGVFETSQQMVIELQCLVPSVEQWAGATYSSMPLPAAYIFIDATAAADTVCGTLDSSTLAYCPTDNRVYMGEAATWELYSEAGDAAVAAVLAHEVTHHFQNRVGMVDGTGRDQIRFENQADCGAGAFMSYARRQGLMNGGADLHSIATALVAVASEEGPERDHGTVTERLQSFDLAFTSELENPMFECVGFVPETPIIG